jgi:hypothetical protein
MLSAAIADSFYMEKRSSPKTENKEKQSPHIRYGLKHHRPEYVPAYFVQNKDFCWIQTHRTGFLDRDKSAPDRL